MLIYLTCGAMIFTFIAVWIPGRVVGQPCWLFAFAITLMLAFFAQMLLPIAYLWIVIAFAFFYLLHKKPTLKKFLIVPLALYLLIMGLGILPGFVRIVFIEPELLGDSLIPYGLRGGLSKPVAGLLALAWLAPRCQQLAQFGLIVKNWQVWLLPALLVIALAWALGISIDIKWVWWTPLFVLINTFFTVLPEEAFFRGFLQMPLQKRFGKALWIVPLVAVLFAIVHVPPVQLEVWRFFTIVFIAGLAYAWSFRQFEKVEASVLTHVCVNSMHFIFLTYPMA